MYVEDTGDEPKCVICDSEEECEHFVACIDHTFLECSSGELYERVWDFRTEIESRFLVLLKAGKPIAWEDADLEQIWQQAINDFATEPKELSLDMDAYFRFLVELLQDAGALKHPGSVVDDQGPRFTSTVSLLFADKPEYVIDKALKNLKQMLFRV
jgi:hypothetical protein